ncbi:MAG: redoxin domain-containing protein [Planctomycetota bacterium]
MKNLRIILGGAIAIIIAGLALWALHGSSLQQEASDPASEATTGDGKAVQGAIEKARDLMDEDRNDKAAQVLIDAAEDAGRSPEADRLRIMALQMYAMDYIEEEGRPDNLTDLADTIRENASSEFEEISHIVAADVYKLVGEYEEAKKILDSYLEDYPAPSQEEIDQYKERRNQADEDLADEMPEEHPRTIQRERVKESLTQIELIGQPAPDFEVTTLEGESVSPADYRGKVLLLDFWATWCTPCVEELPELKRVYEKYHDQGLEVLGLSFDEQKDDLTDFIDEEGIEWEQVYLEGETKEQMSQLYGVPPIPAMYLIDADGNVQARGMTLRGKGLEQAVGRLLDEQ